MDACPALETIAAYLDGRLNESERADVAAHLAGCETCYFVFTEAPQVRAKTLPEPIDLPRADASSFERPWRSRKALWSSAAGLVAAASLVFAVARGNLLDDSYRSEVRTLVTAVGTNRTVEGRLTGGFAYGPIHGPVRGVDAPPPSPDVRIAAAEVERKVLGKSSVRDRHVLGLAYLAAGDIARAVSSLEQAVDPKSPSADVLSDLAAAYLARATRSNEPQDLTKALAAADRAVKAESQLAEALFNRAYILERLQLHDESRQAWEEYLRVDNSSAWSEEARQHLRNLP